MEAHEEAKELYEAIVKAQKALDTSNRIIKGCKESEVTGRYDAVRWMLIIARNEAFEMYKEWRGDYQEPI